MRVHSGLVATPAAVLGLSKSKRVCGCLPNIGSAGETPVVICGVILNTSNSRFQILQL